MRYVLLGAASIAIALVGFYRASLLSGRKAVLDAFITSLTQLGLLISYEALPLSEAAKRLAEADDAAAPFWRAFADALPGSLTAQAAWEKALAAAKGTSAQLLALSPEDEAVLDQFASGLGRSDAETQRGGIELAVSRLKPLSQSARELSESRGKVFRSLGVLGALAVFIILM